MANLTPPIGSRQAHGFVRENRPDTSSTPIRRPLTQFHMPITAMSSSTEDGDSLLPDLAAALAKSADKVSSPPGLKLRRLNPRSRSTSPLQLSSQPECTLCFSSQVLHKKHCCSLRRFNGLQMSFNLDVTETRAMYPLPSQSFSISRFV